MYDKEKAYLIVSIAMVFSIAISVYMHIPDSPVGKMDPGLAYSDIVTLLDLRLLHKDVCISIENSKPDFVLDIHAYKKLCFDSYIPIPYKDYLFEYPPIVGLIWYSSTLLAMKLCKAIPLFNATDTEITCAKIVHFGFNAAINVIAYILLVISILRIGEELGLELRRLVTVAILPSFVMYMVYNWDIVASLFSLLGVYAYVKRRPILAGLSLGLAVSTKLLPLLIAIALIYDAVNRELKDYTLRFSISFLVTGIGPYVALACLYPQGFMRMIIHHMSWYCENCIYMILFSDINSPYHRTLAMITIIAAMLFLLAVRPSTTRHYLEVAFCCSVIATAFSYVFTPQMMILVLTFAVLVLKDFEFDLLLLADTANALIMAMFFLDEDIRKAISPLINTPVKYSPWTIDSPVQWSAQIRNLILVLLFIRVLVRLYRSCRAKSY